MFRLVLTVTALTQELILASSHESQNCADVMVQENNSRKVKSFTSKEGEVLFFPTQDFEGITIKLAAAEKKSTGRVTREDLCVNSLRWYSLKLAVHPNSNYHQCKFETDDCSGKCGVASDYMADDFEGFSIDAHGESFWSLKNTGRTTTRCLTPTVLTQKKIAAAIPGTMALPVWLVGVAGGAVALGVVIAVAWIGRHKLKTLYCREQQREMQISVPIRPKPRGCSSEGIETPLKYDPASNAPRCPPPRPPRSDSKDNPVYDYLKVI